MDAQGPACRLDVDAYADRAQAWSAVVEAGFLSGARTDGTVALTFRPSVETPLRRLMALEAECCPFLDFGLQRDADVLRMTVNAPPEAEATLDLFASLTR